jgi:hypothetical protein
MAAMSDFLKVQIRKHLLRTGSWTKPTVLAVALCTAATADSQTGATITEVANANGYARITINPLDANWDGADATGGTSMNAADVNFGTASGAWGTVTHFAICDSATWGDGNLLLHAPLAASKTVNGSDPVRFAAGDIDLTFD